MVGTISFHIVVIVILLFAGFTSKPSMVEVGLLVNFGTDEFGSGLIEPSAGSVQNPSSLPPQQTSVPIQSQEEKVNTQDFDDEAPVIKKVTSDPEVEKKKLEDIEKKRLEEVERKRLEQEELEDRKSVV